MQQQKNITFLIFILVDFQNIHYNFITAMLSSTLNIRLFATGEKYQLSSAGKQFEYFKVFIFPRGCYQNLTDWELLIIFSNIFIVRLGIPRYYISILLSFRICRKYNNRNIRNRKMLKQNASLLKKQTDVQVFRDIQRSMLISPFVMTYGNHVIYSIF